MESLRGYETLGWWLLGLSIVTFVGSLVAVPLLVMRMPSDYFVRRKSLADSWRGQHPIVRLCLVVLKNLLGFILVLAGIIMSIPPVPGQGILTLLIGLSLLDFPGKRKLEIKIVSAGPVRKTINWIRARGNRPPLELPSMEPNT